LAWTIKPTRRFERELSKLDKSVQRKIIAYLETRVAVSDNPRALGKALGYDLAGFWRYRVGDYRILCQIEDEQLVIVAVSAGHRSTVYER
jgi:mRNA interferase RelE/StbE